MISNVDSENMGSNVDSENLNSIQRLPIIHGRKKIL